jgi:hypothetical protein
MFIYILTYVYIYRYTHTYIYIYLDIHIVYTYTHTYIHIYKYILYNHTHTHTYTYTIIHTYTVYICVCIYIRICLINRQTFGLHFFHTHLGYVSLKQEGMEIHHKRRSFRGRISARSGLCDSTIHVAWSGDGTHGLIDGIKPSVLFWGPILTHTHFGDRRSVEDLRPWFDNLYGIYSHSERSRRVIYPKRQMIDQ